MTKKTLIMFIAVLLAILLPISLSFWVLNLMWLSGGSSAPTPLRWFLALLIPIMAAVYGRARRSVDWSGALFGYLVAFIFTLTDYGFLAALVVFFFSGSKLTKFRGHLKKKFESDYEKSSERNWLQVCCNGGVAAQLSVIRLLENGVGGGERPLDFANDYMASWLSVAVLGALCCACGDTWSSELGSVVGGRPRMVTRWWIVAPRGTNGAVTVGGFLAAIAGGFLVSFGYYSVMLLCCQRNSLDHAPPQWPILLIGAVAGFFGSLVDSLLGATLQYSGVHIGTGRIVQKPGDRVKWISGWNVLDNHAVNLVSTLITALVMPVFAIRFYSYILS